MTGKKAYPGQLSFDLPQEPAPPEEPPEGRVVRVLTDVTAIDRAFDYLVPTAWETDGRSEALQIGSRVRIPLAGRRVGGWVIADDVQPPPGVKLRALAKLSSRGPSEEIIDLARWAAHRWAGRLSSLLKTASPAVNVARIPPAPAHVEAHGKETTWAARALEQPRTSLRLPPGFSVLPLLKAAARRGDTLVIAPTLNQAQRYASELRQDGLPVALMPRDWARAAAGGMVIGTRSAVLAPVASLAAVIVIDEHDEAHQEERNPTWHARELAIERARRAGVPCVLTSPNPSLEALAWGEAQMLPRAEERQSWPKVDLIDRRPDDPVRSGLLSEALVPLIRGEQGDPVICVLNRKGRSRLLACAQCGNLICCEDHQVPLTQDDQEVLICPIDQVRRPAVCESCGSVRFKNLRAGVTRVREELEALARRPVVEVTADTPESDLKQAKLLVGTEAVLHRVDRAACVVFLEFDQELLAPRTRANEQAMALIIRAARLLGGRQDGGRLAIQTRLPDHEVLQATLLSDPSRLVEPETVRRQLLNLPPFSALAQISGAAAQAFITNLGHPKEVDVLGPRDGAWLVRAKTAEKLADVLAQVERPPGRLRIEVGPLRA